jgi:TPP-dependent pyruvate/acetoin dehydrogenase alpha subunit
VYQIESAGASYKKPLELATKYENAYKFVKNRRVPFLLRVNCYRWTEHVGIGEDWQLGYRIKSELDPWKETDIIENPSVINIEKEYAIKFLESMKCYFRSLFSSCAEEPEPIAKDLLTNVT